MYFFPAAEKIAQADMQGLGIVGSRITALQTLARAVVEGDLPLDRYADREQTVTRLQQIAGIGPWTASYIAMRALGDPDAFPAADLGLRRAFERHGLPADVKSITERAETWRPWRAYATHHLWASLPVAQPARPVSIG